MCARALREGVFAYTECIYKKQIQGFAGEGLETCLAIVALRNKRTIGFGLRTKKGKVVDWFLLWPFSNH
jgi:hypothetical protein